MLSRLGAGGFGEVHLALDSEGRTVAVKVLHPHVAADGGALARLAREVETMRRVGGPHVAEVLDASLEGARPYLVTRYVQGRPLSAVPAPVADLRPLATGLADALLAIHEAGVVHRDLKPANVMMTEGDPVVIDFGIASALDSLSVTASGAVVGTPGYSGARRCWRAASVGRRRTCSPSARRWPTRRPVASRTGRGRPSAVAYRAVHHEPDLEGVPGWLEPLLRECLATDPAARPTAARICARLGVDATPPARRLSRFSAVRRAREESDVHTCPRANGSRAGARRRSRSELSRARHRERVRRRWLIGSGLFMSLLAAAAREPLPEVALFLLAAFTLAVVADAGVALVAQGAVQEEPDHRRLRRRWSGTLGISLALSAFFSTPVLALFAGTALVVGIVFVLSA